MVRPLHYHEAATPLGPITVIVDDNGALVAIDFAPIVGSFTLRRLAAENGGSCVLDTAGTTARARSALAEFFAGARRDFDGLPLAPRGTPFQLSVWAELRRIPFGATRSYGELAAALGKPGASRAVGRANGANPIPLVVPCHRVIGANGALTGFSAVGGVETKRWLLNFERGGGDSDGQSEMNFGVARATLPAAHAAEPRVVATTAHL